MSEKHTLSVLVENKPGVLTRVSALFTRRGFNIHSLAVGPTEHESISRITVIADTEGLAMEQVTKQRLAQALDGTPRQGRQIGRASCRERV